MTDPEMDAVLMRYPRLRNLMGKVPLDLVRAELLPSVRDYEQIKPRADRLIPTINLGDVLPAEAERGHVELEDFLGQWGNVSVEELCKICLIVRWLKPHGLFEFGTYNGLSTVQMLLNAPADATVVTLDIKPDSPDAAALDIGGIDRHLAQKAGVFQFEVGHKFAALPLRSRIRQVWGDSTKFDFRPYLSSMNLVFIDAGHTYEYVKNDTENALRLLDPSRDGIILWHDYDQVLHPDVMRCLCDFAEKGVAIHHLRNTNLAVHRQPPQRP